MSINCDTTQTGIKKLYDTLSYIEIYCDRTFLHTLCWDVKTVSFFIPVHAVNPSLDQTLAKYKGYERPNLCSSTIYPDKLAFSAL
jgi:hypothetical protein